MRKVPLAALILATSARAMGQGLAPPANQQEIVVEGNRDRDGQLRDFVQALTPAPPYNGQIARFEWSVCPAVFGLRPVQNQAVAARIRQIATAIGAKADPEPCRGNSLVIVADDKDAMFAWMKRKLPGYFVNSAGRKLVIPREKSHAIGWHVSDLLNADGTQATVDQYGIYRVKSEFASHTRPNSRPHYLASVLIVDRAALDGLTTTEFGDYAAMRTFAQVDPDKLEGQTAPTILTILDAPMESPLPLTLTQWDLSFLRGLYATPENEYAVTQRRRIARYMGKHLSTTDGQPGE